MTKHWKLWATGIGCYLIFMLFLVPAAWWLKLVPLPSGLAVGQVTGTLWRGEITAVRYQQLGFSNVGWQLKPAALLTGKIRVALQSGSLQQTQLPYLDAVADYGFGGLQLNNSLLKLPVAQLVPALQLPLPVQATGELMLDVKHYSQGTPWCGQLTGAASWLDARLQPPGSNWLDLQSIYAELSCEQGNLQLITDGQNALGLAITASLDGNSRLSVNGTVKPEASMPEEVHQAMKFIGRPDAEGRYNIRF